MNREENLTKLKALKIERKKGSTFKSQAECLAWLENVLPLLKFNSLHYNNFQHHAQFMYVSTLSADFLMSHLNPMIGIVNQAINELEINPVENPTAGKTASKGANNIAWDNKPLGKIFIGITVGIFVAATLWAIAHYANLNLRN